MSSQSFRSVFMVASCAGAALGCYLVSLRVASERAALEQVETRIVLAQRDIRVLQTEIGTRGRLAQLERWNVRVLALSAPSADQFLDGGFALAKMVAPRDKVDLDAPVVLAAAPADGPKPQVVGRQPPQPQADGRSAGQMLHVASLNRDTLKREATATPEKAIATPKPATAAVKPVPDKTTGKPTNKPAAVAAAPARKTKPATVAKASAAKAKPPAAKRKSTSPDPLAPIGPAARPDELAAALSSNSGKDNGTKQ